MQFFSRKIHKKYIRSVVLILVLGFAVGYLQYSERLTVRATTSSEKLEEAEDDLEEAEEKISEIQGKSDKTAADMAEASAILDSIIAAQEQLQKDMETLQGQIDQNNLDLIAAQDDLDEQYASMKLRIQFMYENSSGDSFWEAIISADNFSDMINRVEYISEVYDADRKLMDDYTTALENVETLGEQLAMNMEDLQTLQAQYQEEQETAEATIAILEEEADTYADQLAEANTLRDTYEGEVKKWEDIIREEEAAAARANAATYQGGGTGSGGLGTADYLYDDSYDPAFTTDINPDDLVNYALQFVGNRYVWGGNSLTEGCDCSGFVHLIYQNFGISTPRYSQSFKTVGQPVAYNNLKAGDVVVYPGHVAIYIGNGCIVEAQSTAAGITSYRSVNCHTITAIRRLL